MNDIENQTFHQWKMKTNFTESQLRSYIAYFTWEDGLSVKILTAQRVIRLLISVFGVLGTVVEIIVLQRRKDFKAPSFMYHQVIAVFDFMVVFGSVIQMCYILFNPDAYFVPGSFVSAWYRYVHAGLFSFGSFGVKLAVSLERIVAIWIPTMFHKINNYTVVKIATALSLLHGCEYLVDFAQPLMITSPSYGTFVNARAVIQLGVGFSLMLASIIVAAGLINLTKKQKLMDDSPASMERAKANRQLVYLSLSCSIPLFIDSAMFNGATLANGLCNRGNMVCELGAKALRLPYEEAMYKAYWSLATDSITTVDNIIWTIGEAGHFYFYYLLCTPFRDTTNELFLKYILRKDNVISLAASGSGTQSKT